MKTFKFYALLFMLLSVGYSSKVSADAIPVLSFTDSSTYVEQNYLVGDTFSLDVWLFGLDEINLGSFDFDVLINHSITSYHNATFSTGVSDFDILEYGYDAGELNLAGVSYEFDLSSQADALKVATIDFVASAVGVSQLVFSDILFSDENGSQFSLDSKNVFGATINVTAPSVSVDEPSTSWVYFSAILALLFSRRKR